jgi:hypothetical protein
LRHVGRVSLKEGTGESLHGFAGPEVLIRSARARAAFPARRGRRELGIKFLLVRTRHISSHCLGQTAALPRNHGRSTHVYITKRGNTAQEVDRSTNRALSELGGADACSREIRPSCGVRIVTTPETDLHKKKNPGIAAVASIVLPGLGQIYTEQTRKGVALVVVAVFLLYVIVTVRNIASELANVLYLALLLYGAYDAYNTAKMINEGLT